jgi:hypothetical protein
VIDRDPRAIDGEREPNALHPSRVLRAPLGEPIDDEPLRGRASLAEDVDDVDAGARRERTHQRVHRILTGAGGSVEPRRGSIRSSGVEPVLTRPDGADGDRRLRGGVWDDLGMRHATNGIEEDGI